MAKSSTTIEFNGRVYDARTGAVINNKTSQNIHGPDSNSVNKSKQEVTKKIKVSTSSGTNVDGFVKKSKVNKSQVSKTKPSHIKRSVQKSKTLMRPAVKKPEPKPHDNEVKRQPKLSPKVNHARISRAENTARSQHIQRFNNVKPEVNRPVAKKEAHLSVVPSPVQAVSKGVSNELKRLENALIDANSHLHELEGNAMRKAPFLQRVGFKNKFANVTAMSMAVLLLVGFFGYQNSTQISTRVASARAGVDAGIPSYKPAGYGISKRVAYEPGKVTLTFNSRSSDNQFMLTQQTSNWSSASLLANHVNKGDCNSCYKTWQERGKTIYIYDDNNATWVDGGIWYLVEGDAQLSSDQLLKIASSL